MAIIQLENISSIRKNSPDKKIVFASGTFDLTHAGHILFFEDCKKYGDILVVGVGSDEITRQRKSSGRPILNEHVRLKNIDSLKPVDFAFIDYISTKEDKLGLLNTVLDKLRPNYYIINEDAFDIETRKTLCDKYGVALKILPRYCPPEFDRISRIIEKIKELKD